MLTDIREGTRFPLASLLTWFSIIKYIRNTSWGLRRPVPRADNTTTVMWWLSWNLGASTSWNPLGLTRPVMELVYPFFFFTSTYFRSIFNCSDCTAPNSVVGTNYAAQGHCTMMSLPIRHIHLITCMQGFRTVTSGHAVEFGSFGISWHTAGIRKTTRSQWNNPIAKRVLMYPQFGGPLMIMLTRESNCSYSIEC